MKNLPYRYPRNQILPVIPYMKLFVMIQGRLIATTAVVGELDAMYYDNMLNTTFLRTSLIRKGYFHSEVYRLVFDDVEIKVPKVRGLQRQRNMLQQLIATALSEAYKNCEEVATMLGPLETRHLQQ
ncbi:MAG: hypothetical protein ACTS73_08555 [Arsenophonus sp. NEOnobi-MAG3]